MDDNNKRPITITVTRIIITMDNNNKQQWTVTTMTITITTMDNNSRPTMTMDKTATNVDKTARNELAKAELLASQGSRLE